MIARTGTVIKRAGAHSQHERMAGIGNRVNTMETRALGAMPARAAASSVVMAGLLQS